MKRTGSPAALLLALLLTGAAGALAPGAGAQALGGYDLGQSGEPIEIDADQGIEWNRNARTYTARGNARAARGDLAIYADVLTAHYRDSGEGGARIWRIEASGNVRMTSPNETIFGDQAVYDVEDGMLRMTGRNLRVETPGETLTAEESLEYHETEERVLARGNAVVTQGDRRVRADLMSGYFRRDSQGRPKLYQVEAEGDVRISTPSESARAAKAAYNLDTQIATLSGDVRLTRGENQLNGQYAEVNLRTGISRITGSPEQRVQTLIVPSTKPQPADSE